MISSSELRDETQRDWQPVNWRFGSLSWLNSALLAIAATILVMFLVLSLLTIGRDVGCVTFNAIDAINQDHECGIAFGGASVKAKQINKERFTEIGNHKFREVLLTLKVLGMTLLVIFSALCWFALGTPTRYRSNSRQYFNGWLLLPLAFVVINVPRLFALELSAITVFLMALVALMIAFSEEMWFRAIIARFFRNHSAGFFIVISSLFFALGHDRELMFFAGVFGACLAIAYTQGASIWYLVTSHALLDFGMKLPRPPDMVYEFFIGIGLPVLLDIEIGVTMLIFVLMYLMHPKVWRRPCKRDKQFLHPGLHWMTKLPIVRYLVLQLRMHS